MAEEYNPGPWFFWLGLALVAYHYRGIAAVGVVLIALGAGAIWVDEYA